MKAKTIPQYCILRWIEANFVLGGLDIDFIDTDVARIEDQNGETAFVKYKDDIAYLDDTRD